MSDFARDVKFSLKVVINKEKTRVLYAEIDSDLADVLFSFLTLPLGKIVRILKKHYGDEAPVFGSITTLYDGLSNLDSSHFWTEGGKQMLLDPTSSFIDECSRLKLDIGDNQPIKYFTCENLNCSHPRSNNLGMYFDTVRCDCGKKLKREIPVMNVSKAVKGGVFTKRMATFIITDDLQILPNVTASFWWIVPTRVGMTTINDVELMNLTFGYNEIVDLLKYSLLSSTPLTNVVLKKQHNYLETSPIGKMAPFNSVRIKVIFQFSRATLLFVEADEDFIEILFSFLIISLGGLECLFGFRTSLKSIDNLYNSLAFPNDDKYLSLQRYRLIRPTIPCCYLSKSWIFSLIEGASELCYCKTSSRNEEYLAPSGGVKCIFKSPRGQSDYIKGPRKYMVKDDLTVTPMSITAYLNTLIEQDIQVLDVREKVLDIGSEEISDILNASLSSTSALSNSLEHLYD